MDDEPWGLEGLLGSVPCRKRLEIIESIALLKQNGIADF